MQTTLTRYAPGILSFLVAILTAVNAIPTLNLVTVLQVLILGASSFVVLIVPLFPAKWQGGWKTGVELVGVLLVAFLPFAIEGTWNKEQLILIVIALIKAGATELGVKIRTDTTIDAGTAAPGAASTVTTLKEPAKKAAAAKTLESPGVS